MKKVDDNEFMKMVAKGSDNTGKEEPKKPVNNRKGTRVSLTSKLPCSDYLTTFMQRGSEGEKRTVYLNKDVFSQLKKIVSTIGGDKSTMGGYVETIVISHFEQYKDEIIRLFNENIKQPFQ